MRALRSFSVFDGERFLAGGATVLVEGETIVGVEPVAYEVADGCEVTEYAGTLLPGLIDCHVHLVFDGDLAGPEAVGGLSDADLDARITAALGRQVAHGVTTVRDLGDVRYRTLVHRDRRQSGLPRIVAAGPPITVPGGHCHFMGGVVGPAASLEAAVAERVDRGVDVIKVMASGGLLTPGSDQFGAQFETGALRELGELAHARGLRVRAHAHSLVAMERVVEAGLDGIEHFSGFRIGGTHLPPELLDRVAAQDIGVCPTIGQDVAALPPPSMMPPGMVKVIRGLGIPPGMPLEEFWEHLSVERLAHMALAHAHGVRLLSGLDAGVGPGKAHGELFGAVVDLATAIPLADALASATSVAADDCGVAAGRIRAGLSADLVALDADLREDPDALGRPVAVMVRGQQVR